MLEYLYEALASEAGKVIVTSDVEKLRQNLYKARREALDPELDQLALIPSPTNPTGELWIVKKGKKPDAPESQ